MRPWPLREVPVATLQQLQHTLQQARIDQALVWALIEGGFGGSDLAHCLATPLLASLQATEPVSPEWQLLVLQALRDPRAVWEPAFVTDRARLRRHLQSHPGVLLRRLCEQLERPWNVPLQTHRATRRIDAGPPPGAIDAPRDAGAPPTRERALLDLQQLWHAWADGALPDELMARCVRRACRLHRQEPARWEPLVAVDPLREHLHGSDALHAMLERIHLTPAAPSSSRHPVAEQVLAVAARARHDPLPAVPFPVAGAQRRSWSAAACGMLLLQSVLPAMAPRSLRVRADATSLVPRPTPEPAPCAGVQAAPSAGLSVDFRYSSGVRPDEALHTVARSFTDTVCARWLGIAGRSAADFNEGLQQVMHQANLSAAACPDPESAVTALLERGQGALEHLMSRVQLPLFARQLVDRSSHLTRVFLLARAVSRQYALIRPRNAGDSALREAAQWMQAIHDGFVDLGYSDAVRAAVSVGDAAQWLAPAGPSTPEPSSTPPSSPSPTLLEQINGTALEQAVRAVLPGNGTVLQDVLLHVLGRAGFPDSADLELTLGRLHGGNRTRDLVARIAAVPFSQVDDALCAHFYQRLASVSGPTPGTAAAQWRAQLVRHDTHHVLRGTWIAGLTPLQAATLFHQDPQGSVDALLGEVLAAPAAASTGQPWSLRLQGTERLTAWLDSTSGQQRMAGLLRAANASLPSTPAFLFEADGLPTDIALDLLRRAVSHHLPDNGTETLDATVANARPALCPILSLAVALRTRHPLLQASTCFSYAAVLLAPRPTVAAQQSMQAAPAFPLPAFPGNATLPALHLDSFLHACGLPLFEALDSTLTASQAWHLMARTSAFQSAARPLLRALHWHGGAANAVTSPQAEQSVVASWILQRGLGEARRATLVAGLDDARARERPMQATREALQAQLPQLTHRTGASLLRWLLVQHAGRPEWGVHDIPAWLDYGRSLQSVSFLQGVGLAEAAAAGATTHLDYGTLVGLPRALAAHAGDEAGGQHRLLVEALVRPALLYAQAHLPAGDNRTSTNADKVSAALDLVARQQNALALAASQLAAQAPQRRGLAAQQLRAAGVPERYWNQTLEHIPATTLTTAGIARRVQIEPQPDPHVVGLQLLVRSVDEAIAQDSLLLLLVGGVYEVTGQPSITHVFEQAFAQYRQQMTQALEGLLDRALDMLPGTDQALLRNATITPLMVPDGAHGVVLRCTSVTVGSAASKPVYLAVIPSAGFAARLERGERFDGQQWTRGVLYDPRAFASGEVKDRVVPENQRFLPLDACTAGAALSPPAEGSLDRAALLRAAAGLMHGDFFNRVRNAELAQRTGLETLADAEADFAVGLARFAVPFYGCVRDVMEGDAPSAAVDCTLDAAGLLLPGTQLARFLRSTTALVLRGGEITAGALLRGAGVALMQLGKEIAAQSGLMLVRDLGRGVLRAGRATRAWVLAHAPALEARLAGTLRGARTGERQLREAAAHWPTLSLARVEDAGDVLVVRVDEAWHRFDLDARRPFGAVLSLDDNVLRVADEIAPGFALDGPLRGDGAVHAFETGTVCARVRRQVNVPALCSTEAITLFDFAPSPVFDAPGDVGWFAGMQVVSDEPFTAAGRRFVFDGEVWQQTRAGSGYRFTRAPGYEAPVPRASIRATVRGGESQLLRVELHNPYVDHQCQVTQGAVVGRAADGGRAVITRVAPGRFHVALLEGNADTVAGRVLDFQPLETLGFTAAQNEAVKTAWWGAFHYSQQCRLSGVQLVDRFGSQLQRQLEQLDELGQQLEEVRAGSPFRFESLPAQMVMSCAQSNCRYVQELRRQIGPASWRVPRADDLWLDSALRDVLSPPTPAASGTPFTALDDTLEARYLTPRRGPAKTLAVLELTLRDDPVPRVFHSTSGQRKGRSLLPIANLDNASAPAGWRVDGKEVITPTARYIDAQPSQVSISSGQVAGTVPNHSLHAEDLDGPLFNERNARSYDAERNVYYRVERYIADNRLDPSQVTGARLFSSRTICASCHISVGSLRARLPNARFEVIERAVPGPSAALDTRPGTGT